jgi:magnesium-transporting ATPase (P-type)
MGLATDSSRLSAPPTGLTAAEVADRHARGQSNKVPERTSRSYTDIVRANVLTRFNAIIAALAAVVLVVGHPIDAVFAFVLLFNTAIGIVQEVRAKRTLDRLRVLIAPTIAVLRDGRQTDVLPGELVLDDVVLLAVGDQVPVDGRVLESSGLEVDESALTGEADPVAKQVGDEVLSGSAVVSGSASVVAVRVGEQAWIHQLVAQAKQFVLTRSELRAGVDQILRVVNWIILPLAALLLWSQLRGQDSLSEALVSAVAGVVGLVPQGLVLLVSLAMAVAIVRLARNHVVVQELYAVEGLARVDVLCVDKTGTLTTGKFSVEALEPFAGGDGEPVDGELRDGLGALAATEQSPTAAMRVLAAELGGGPGWQVGTQVAFSSARKWSGATFAGHGTWVVGAPEILLDAMPADEAEARRRIAVLTEASKRVLLVGCTSAPLDPSGSLPGGLRPVGLVVLAEEVRSDAGETMAYFARQHVAVKVISGDNPRTVSAVAAGLGIDGAHQFVDMREVTGPLDDIVEQTTIFGRVLPEQKRELVEALQRAGHVVAMTGDGVNDIPALKKADIGIAVDTATPATKAVSQLVLLDGRFDRLPNVVAEGRRVIANMERVSALFVTKTVYAAIFAVVIGVSGAAFPFLPRHMSLVSELTIGIPAFVLSFRASEMPSRSGYLRRVTLFAVPAGVIVATVTLAAYWLAQSAIVDASLAESRTASTFALVSVAFWVLYRLMRPVDGLDAILMGSLALLFTLVLAVAPIRRFYALDFPDIGEVLLIAALTWAGVMAFELAVRLIGPRLERHPRVQHWRHGPHG